MNIIMLGAPGSGKGTVGIDLCEKFGFETFSTGAIFREEIENETELGKIVQEYISSGGLVPDDVTIKIVEKGLEKYPNGAIFDGFPRTIAQAEALKEMLAKNNNKIDVVLNLNIPELKNTSDVCKDLISKLLERNVSKRITKYFLSYL